MVNLWCSASDRIRVPACPASHVHRRVPDVRRRTRRSAAAIGGGYTGHDHRTCCRGSRGSASLVAGGRAFLVPRGENLIPSELVNTQLGRPTKILRAAQTANTADGTKRAGL
jgi:hypothetical protein